MSEFSKRWEKVFDRYEIQKRVESDGYADISAREFKEINFEPRLLTKIDHSVLLPPVMADSNLSILTLSASTWRIGPFGIFEILPDWESTDKVENKHFPEWIESINPERITGEGAVVNTASITGILESFCENELQLTISGKSRSGDFDFKVDSLAGNADIQVRGAQIEIDAGFESKDEVWVIEAKKRKSLDFNIRQLYYPYRAWQQRISKPIRTIYLVHSNDYYDLYEYEFTDTYNLSSIQLVKKSRYTVNAEPITRRELVAIAKNSPRYMQQNPDITFAQADDFERVIDLLDFLVESPRTKDEITTKCEFDERQSDYYFKACQYIGLAEKDSSGNRIASNLGKKIFKMEFKQKRLEIARILFSIDPIADLYLEYVNGKKPSKDEIANRFENSNTSHGISGTTLERRAQTVNAWVKWLLALGA